MIQSLGELLPSVTASVRLAGARARECRGVCDSGAGFSLRKVSSSGSVSCSCEALDWSDLPESQSVFKVCEDEVNALEDWEFAGDEEKEDAAEDFGARAESLRTGTVPDLFQLSLPLPAEASLSSAGISDQLSLNSNLDVRAGIDGHGDEELGQPRPACDWLEPPMPSGAVAMQEGQHQSGGEEAMLEAFQQFQHNPHVQEMVVALATDARVWRAVLANKKLQEYRAGNAEGDVEVRISTQDLDPAAIQSRRLSNFVLVSQTSLRHWKEGLRVQIRGIVEIVDMRLQAETRQLMLDVVLRASMMMTIFMLTLTAFLVLLPLQVSQGA